VTLNNQGQEKSRSRKQVEYFSEDLGNGTWLDMVMIPGGSFLMGSPAGEGNANERPQHPVTVKPFCMGKFAVTQAQWRAVAAMPKVEKDLNSDPAHFKGAMRPVERVSWDDAVEFCQRLSRHTKRDYRLPSEAEWEYACRAGTTTHYHFGDTITGEYVNCNCQQTVVISEGILGIGRKEEKRGIYKRQTTEVGSFPPNAFGLYDMHGNVWEWCLDHLHDTYEGAPTDGSAWLFSDESKSRLLRGGSWYFDPRNCRSAARGRSARDFQDFNIGFRLVCASSWAF
jgi:formylglycine-generating enzyme required for sulfatase activity